MATELEKTITDLLNEEKWTRATLNSYSITNFKDLDTLIEQARSEGIAEEVRELAGEHLKHTSNSIIALYLSGVLALSRELVDDTNLIMLISIFMDNHKWNVVEFLAERILEYGENKYALRTLGDCYENRNDEAKKLEVWDRLIRVDYEEADIVKILGEKREQAGDLPAAVDYYKKAIHRFINKKQFASVKELWDKLIHLSPEDIDFFFHIEGRIARAISGERAAALLTTLIPHYREKEDWDTSIEILKKILSYDSKNGAARKDIIECYRHKYEKHSQLEEYIKISNLTQNWRNVHEAIADFEKHIAFDTGNYVFHRTWGIGRISASKDDTFTIDFSNKSSHKMSLKMAVSALEVLSAEHIWVLKRTSSKDDLAKRVKAEPAWALRTIIRSFGNQADMKKIKAELVPDVLTAGEWSRWSTEARSILKKDSAFGNLPDKVDQFVVRDKPISFEEKVYNKFKAEKGFFERVKTIEDYIQGGRAEPDSDWFTEMFSYFTAFLKGFTVVSETVLGSWLLVQRIVSFYPFLSTGVQITFEDLFGKIENLEETFTRLDDPDLKKDFLVAGKRSITDWPSVFSRLFVIFPSKFIVDELVANAQWDVLGGMLSSIVSRYREQRDAFVWVAKNLLRERWLEDRVSISREKVFIGMIHLLDITFRDIANKQNASNNRKTNRQIQEFLFEEGRLLEFLMAADQDSITRLFTLVDDVKEVDPSLKIQLKHRIKEKYPNFHFLGEPGVEKVSLGLLVTRASFEKKQQDLKRVIDVEIPENSKEIGVAMSKGDLRENAEYKAALEKQEMLKVTASRLKEEVQQAQIFNENETRTDSISFGTRVRLKNLKTGQAEEYVILGPWESNPSRNVISYLSPLGVALWSHKPGEELAFTINQNEFHYTVENIEKADLKTI
ncbi:MAG TPA: transcription elongation factor GreA [Spirochaetia bacterium]|nr:transcription elongation factor GreA [Spirochaetia bacterium]